MSYSLKDKKFWAREIIILVISIVVWIITGVLANITDNMYKVQIAYVIFAYPIRYLYYLWQWAIKTLKTK
jgi:hypothetical protein